MKDINKADLKIGDVVGVPLQVGIGWSKFRYPKIVPEKIKRITPARTKFVTESGREFGKNDAMYNYDDEAISMSKVAEDAEFISDFLYRIDQIRGKGKLYSQSDEVITEVANLFRTVMEILEPEVNE